MLLRKIAIEKVTVIDFINAFNEHIHFKSSSYNLYDYIEAACEFLLQFPKVNTIAYFKMNPKTFLFDLFYCYPDEKNVLIQEYFNDLLDNDIIGQIIDQEMPFFYQKENKMIFDNIVLCPIQNHNKIFGLFLIIIDNDFNYNNDLLNKLDLFNKFLAALLESVSLKKQLDNTQKMLEQKVAERTLDIITSKRELQAIFNSVNTAILVFDSQTNKLVQANSVALQLLQTNVDKIQDLNYTEFFDDIENFENLAFSRNFESILRYNKLNIPILRSTASITLGKQKLRIESFIDITQRKKIEEELRKSNIILEKTVRERTKDLEILVEKLKNEIEERKKIEKEIKKALEKEQELLELKSKFISLVSHEFRTPLTLINSSAQIILSYKDRLSDKDIEKYLSRIMETVDYMTGLLENVIFIEKSENNLHHLNFRRIDLTKLIQNIIKDFRLAVDEKRIIQFLHPETPAIINSDENSIRHIIYNLLSNADKYSDRKKEIIVELLNDKTDYIIKVKDFGIGIPNNEKNKIFDQFFRGSNVGNISGTGLGMSVILKSVKSISGKIDLESKEGFGTTFIISLPKNSE